MQNYDIHLDTAFQPLEHIDVKRFAQEHQPWWNQTLCAVNDCVVRLGVLHGDFHWHKHDDEDEFFFVMEGKLLMELEDKTVELGPGQSILIPKGTMHLPHAPERTTVLMFEGSGVVPTGDA